MKLFYVYVYLNVILTFFLNHDHFDIVNSVLICTNIKLKFVYLYTGTISLI